LVVVVGVGGDGGANAVCGRFHAWQSALLFTALFVVHLLFAWSTFLSWVFFLGDLALIAWLVLNAYRDADTLDRYVLTLWLSAAWHVWANSVADTRSQLSGGLRAGFWMMSDDMGWLVLGGVLLLLLGTVARRRHVFVWQHLYMCFSNV
jgi:hypothetical protein